MEEPVADQTGEIEALQATIAGLQGEVTELKARMTEDTQRIEILTERVAELGGQLSDAQAARESLIKIVKQLIEVLKLPGVRKWLLERFHPDRYPDARPVQRHELENTASLINAAYDIVNEPPAPSGE
jgi:uncharacterized coiled-coil protein SlyX